MYIYNLNKMYKCGRTPLKIAIYAIIFSKVSCQPHLVLVCAYMQKYVYNDTRSGHLAVMGRNYWTGSGLERKKWCLAIKVN